MIAVAWEWFSDESGGSKWRLEFGLELPKTARASETSFFSLARVGDSRRGADDTH